MYTIWRKAAMAMATSTCGIASVGAGVYLLRLKMPIRAYCAFIAGVGLCVISTRMYKISRRSRRRETEDVTDVQDNIEIPKQDQLPAKDVNLVQDNEPLNEAVPTHSLPFGKDFAASLENPNFPPLQDVGKSVPVPKAPSQSQISQSSRRKKLSKAAKFDYDDEIFQMEDVTDHQEKEIPKQNRQLGRSLENPIRRKFTFETVSARDPPVQDNVAQASLISSPLHKGGKSA